jgi:hypothetical protein
MKQRLHRQYGEPLFPSIAETCAFHGSIHPLKPIICVGSFHPHFEVDADEIRNIQGIFPGLCVCVHHRRSPVEFSGSFVECRDAASGNAVH